MDQPRSLTISRRGVASLIGGGLAAPFVVKASAFAQGKSAAAPKVVELFTSQGCSSCPPADALMLNLAEAKSGILPLTFAVEVWDYLGWRDTLAKPLFTARQKAYAAKLAESRVYTPQAIINGRAHCVGSDRARLETLARDTGEAGQASLAITQQEADEWRIEASGTAEMRVFMLPVAARKTVPIGRGENSGRTITYANVVRGIEERGGLGGAEPARFTLSRADLARQEADCAAILVQAGTLAAPGKVFAAGFIKTGEGRA